MAERRGPRLRICVFLLDRGQRAIWLEDSLNRSIFVQREEICAAPGGSVSSCLAGMAG